jgi:hypothetical protein
MDVRHVPGITNIVDGLSSQHKGQPHTDSDGSSWVVSPDWEEMEGLVLGVYNVTVLKETEYAALFQKRTHVPDGNQGTGGD